MSIINPLTANSCAFGGENSFPEPSGKRSSWPKLWHSENLATHRNDWKSGIQTGSRIAAYNLVESASLIPPSDVSWQRKGEGKSWKRNIFICRATDLFTSDSVSTHCLQQPVGVVRRHSHDSIHQHFIHPLMKLHLAGWKRSLLNWIETDRISASVLYTRWIPLRLTIYL